MANPNWKKGISGNPNGRPKGSGLSPYIAARVREVIDLAESENGNGLVDFMRRNNDDFWKIILAKSLVSSAEVDVTSGGEPIRHWTIELPVARPDEDIENILHGPAVEYLPFENIAIEEKIHE